MFAQTLKYTPLLVTENFRKSVATISVYVVLKYI